jgi:hypothetical protein
MFLDLTKGHWLSVFRNRFPTGAPSLEMRVWTKERPVGVDLADDLPNYSGHSGRLMLKLITAWIAMGFRRPEITLGRTISDPEQDRRFVLFAGNANSIKGSIRSKHLMTNSQFTAAGGSEEQSHTTFFKGTPRMLRGKYIISDPRRR